MRVLGVVALEFGLGDRNGLTIDHDFLFTVICFGGLGLIRWLGGSWGGGIGLWLFSQCCGLGSLRLVLSQLTDETRDLVEALLGIERCAALDPRCRGHNTSSPQKVQISLPRSDAASERHDSGVPAGAS